MKHMLPRKGDEMLLVPFPSSSAKDPGPSDLQGQCLPLGSPWKQEEPFGCSAQCAACQFLLLEGLTTSRFLYELNYSWGDWEGRKPTTRHCKEFLTWLHWLGHLQEGAEMWVLPCVKRTQCRILLASNTGPERCMLPPI